MILNKYQQASAEFAEYDEPFYPVASLMVEAAELSDLFVKPWLRGDNVDVERGEVVSEAGDVLWNLCQILTGQGIDIEEVAHYNLAKLADRKQRGVIRGNGGNR